MDIINELNGMYDRDNSEIFISGLDGYWSNLNQNDNNMLIESLQKITPTQAIRKYQPNLYNVIFSPKRQGGLELLNLKGDEVCVDYGCMWGALAIPLAKRTKFVLGVDQTMDSLKLLKARMAEENVSNIGLLCLDLKKMPLLENKFDVAIINGVLEWIPESGPIELGSYFGQYRNKEYNSKPKSSQTAFLKKVYQNMKIGGKCYLAIENRYDFKMFLGQKDPHANLFFTSFLPRNLADKIAFKKVGRPYVNWIYSFNEIKLLLESSGFGKIELYMAFPDYRFPEKILSYDRGQKAFENYEYTISLMNSKGKKTLKRRLARIAEYVFFKILRVRFLAPSIICIAYK